MVTGLSKEKEVFYKVLANKYRPNNFSQLIGQDFLVDTLTNAINSNRIANAFILNGTRGIGKTTTARILALALNCTSSDNNAPTTNICQKCSNCLAISNYRHPDVIEIDAASHTGVDDIREIIDNSKYLPTSSRYKIYIIDEVHMLSKNAFNALLKTLEEPPEHIKFIFATTEIHKIPITILSRCQRFDLRRLSESDLLKHLLSILDKENIESEEEAIAIIAKIAAGSVRDSLSLLDQAISYSNGIITTSVVQKMVGLVDYENVVTLFKHIISGDTEKALEKFNELYSLGANSINLIQELMEINYTITKLKILPNATILQSYSKNNQKAIKTLSLQLKTSYLIRLWQVLLKSLEEIKESTNTLMTSEMIIIKLCFISDLPSPAELIKNFGKSNKVEQEKVSKENTIRNLESDNYQPLSDTSLKENDTEFKYENQHSIERSIDKTIQSKKTFLNFRELVECFKEKKEAILYDNLMNDVNLVSFEEGKISLKISDFLDKNFVNEISKHLKEWTGIKWQVEKVSNLEDNKILPTITNEIELEKQENFEEIKKDRNVSSVLELFPKSKISEIKAVTSQKNT